MSANRRLLSRSSVKAAMLFVLSVGLAFGARGWSTTVTTGVYPKTGGAKSSLGAEFKASYSVVNATVSSTSVSYSLHETADRATGSIQWISNLAVTYKTLSGKTGVVPTGWSAGISQVKADPIELTVSGDMLENTTTVLREFAVKVTFGNSYSPPVWFVFSQAAGVGKVKVTLLANGGTEPKPYSSYEYTNGGLHYYFRSEGRHFYSGYRQPTSAGPNGGAVGEEELIQYANSFVMPTTTRKGYVFDAWYTVSSYPEANDIRIDEATLPTAKVKTISARWLLAQVRDLGATKDREDMVCLTWRPSEIDVEYVIYRSEANKKPTDCLARVTTNFFEDESAKPGRTYYYWVDANDGLTAPAIGSSVVGSRALERVAAPTFSFNDGDEFLSDAKAISMSCDTVGATIRYTTDGLDPNESSVAFSKKFSVRATTTFKAAAFKDGMRPSEVVTATIFKVSTVSLAEALDVGLNITGGGSGEWTGYSGVSAKVGNDYARSPAIADGESVWIKVIVNGAGTFSFWWKVSCEHDDTGAAGWDAAIFSAPDAEQGEIRRDGLMQTWEQIAVHFPSGGDHVLTWTYTKDEMDRDGEDCLYLDGFDWIPNAAPTTYAVEFDANGGGGTMTREIIGDGQVFKLPKCTLLPPFGGQRFVGWKCSNGRRYDDETLVFNLGNVTMTAIWE